MSRSERVVLRFITSEKTADSAVLLDSWQQIAPASQDLVRVSLVAHVPDETIAWRVERVMQRDGQLDRPERRAGMSAHARHRLENILPNVVSDVLKLIDAETPQVGRRVNLLKFSHLA